MDIHGHPYLSRLLDRDEAWAMLGDFDRLMKGSDERIRSADGPSDAVEAAKLMHDFARDHYHLLLVGQYKIREIGRGIRTALESKNETVLFNMTRAFVEHTAALAYQINALKRRSLTCRRKPISGASARRSRVTTRQRQNFITTKALEFMSTT